MHHCGHTLAPPDAVLVASSIPAPGRYPLMSAAGEGIDLRIRAEPLSPGWRVEDSTHLQLYQEIKILLSVPSGYSIISLVLSSAQGYTYCTNHNNHNNATATAHPPTSSSYQRNVRVEVYVRCSRYCSRRHRDVIGPSLRRRDLQADPDGFFAVLPATVLRSTPPPAGPAVQLPKRTSPKRHFLPGRRAPT